MEKIEILGVKINNISFNQTVKTVDNFIIDKKPKQLVTVNPEFIITAQRDEEFNSILNKADLSVPDGEGLIFVSKYFLNKPLQQRVTGVDLVYAICKLASQKKYPVFLLGGEHGVGELSAKVLKQKFPGLIIAGTYEGKPNIKDVEIEDIKSKRITDIKMKHADPNLKIVAKVCAAKPKILFVAYGAPKQDKFIYRYKKQLNIPIMMGVGGAYDFISGHSKRAPKFIQSIGLEWLWRLVMEPWRYKRIFSATIIFPLLVIKNKLLIK
jgi:N-acetylglucosaminyldiphosphoundecaprenol N-acetyl-beta-D-mannosaminyltransferase